MWIEKVLARSLYRGDAEESDISNQKLDAVKGYHDEIYAKEENRIKTLSGKAKEKMLDKLKTKTKKAKANGKS